MLQDFLLFFQETGFTQVTWQMLVMWAVVAVLFYLAIAKGFEPLLLVPIAFGALIANLPTRGILSTEFDPATQTIQATPKFEVESEILHTEFGPDGLPISQTTKVRKMEGGLFDFLAQGIKLEIFPPLIFLGVGALTDFGPLIANPRMLLLGAAAQLGVTFTFIGAVFLAFTSSQAASIAIIGGADGPTAIFLSNKLAPELLGAIAVAAYSYMALVPLLQPPIMRALTTKAERKIRMKSLRQVSKLEKLCFALLVTVVCIMLVPDASPLIAMLMLGNFLRECGVTQRLVQSAQNEIINVITIFLGVSVGLTMRGDAFLAIETIKIILLGVVAFGAATASGVLVAKLMNVIWRNNPVNPLIGSAGVSAVPMAARVSHLEGQRADPNNFLLMHAMGPNVAGVIGTAVIAGYFIATLAN
ncbi:MAG: sodium ion-translocating decarboxylase subunit beta [Puniceicoccaceae bacterium]|nr:MAG: sodium ion-translocating decarboxylase subunit beta [Puniceicoccaceae bacterium]